MEEKPNPGLRKFLDELLETIQRDQWPSWEVKKRTGQKGDVKFSSGKNHIMQPVYHSLNFKDKRRSK